MNGGMFAGQASLFVAEFAAHAPQIGVAMQQPLAEMVEGFAELPNISIDYAIAEKSDKVVGRAAFGRLERHRLLGRDL